MVFLKQIEWEWKRAEHIFGNYFYYFFFLLKSKNICNTI
jgi:hypothetical protein